MGLLVHLGRAALIFWVAAILLPGAVGQALSVPQQSSPQAALLGVSTTADAGRDRVSGLTTTVNGAEDDVRRVASRVRLEVERFIAQLP
jgi:hypothetical protein